ncbi:MAG: hypothetical protein H6839_11225 [Planctomycetes bacterium]|nr:hypothetical protein [Planctomycetota bacterium]
MSNKKWRKPAPGADAGESQSGAGQSPPETSTSASSVRDQAALRARLQRLPDDYLDDRAELAEDADGAPLEPGVYRTEMGAGHDLIDMRKIVIGLPSPQEKSRPLSDKQVEFILRDAVRFLWQIINLTSSVAETIRVGDLRRAVAGEMAMPGDMVRTDGTISRHPDARKAGETADGPKRTGAKSKSRGSSHPFVMLLRLAVQAARLIRQITSGTHPGVHNKLKHNVVNVGDALLHAEQQMEAILKET